VLARHAGAFDVHRYADEAAARAAIRDRDVYGAVVVSPQDVTVLTASAASPLVALQLRESAVSLAGVGQAPGAAAGQPRVVDVVPADPDDPRGSALSAAVLPLVLTGAASAVLIFLLSRPGIRRAAALVGASVLAGLTADAIAQGWLGVVGGNWLPRPGAGAAMVPARPLRPIRVLRIALARDGLRPPLSTPGMGDRLGVKVPWRKRWC
jgi:hypothetical protein